MQLELLLRAQNASKETMTFIKTKRTHQTELNLTNIVLSAKNTLLTKKLNNSGRFLFIKSRKTEIVR